MRFWCLLFILTQMTEKIFLAGLPCPLSSTNIWRQKCTDSTSEHLTNTERITKLTTSTKRLFSLLDNGLLALIKVNINYKETSQNNNDTTIMTNITLHEIQRNLTRFAITLTYMNSIEEKYFQQDMKITWTILELLKSTKTCLCLLEKILESKLSPSNIVEMEISLTYLLDAVIDENNDLRQDKLKIYKNHLVILQQFREQLFYFVSFLTNFSSKF